MIFFITAAIIAAASIYLLSGRWIKNLYRIIFGLISFVMAALLILFGLEIKLEIKQPATERRIIACAVDVSASTAIKAEDVKSILKNEFSGYNLEILPFSSSLPGPENEESTALVDSLKELFSYLSGRYDEDKIAGVIIISDGNETEKIPELKKELNIETGYPRNAIYLQKKRSDEGFDKSVAFVDVPRFAPLYKKEKITFAVNTTGAGLHAIPVELKLDGKILGSVLVNLSDGYGEGDFEIIIKETGNFLLEASIAEDSREKITSNNTDYAPMEGIIKGFRVLHISGYPSTDTSFIRRGLQNIPGVDMISFYILRTQRQLSNIPESELSLIPFPTDQLFRKELDNFDLIIINDFLLSEFLLPIYISNIAQFVQSGGGLLIFGGGQSFLAKDFITNGLGSILPVVPSAGNNWADGTRYRAVPLDICRLTPLSDLEKIRDLPFRGLNGIQLKENASLFCRASNGSPLIAANFAGKGRVIAVLTDSFWHASYYGGINNETLLKSFVRYLLGISTMPVKISSGKIIFDRSLPANGMKDLTAELSFLDPSGGAARTEVITPLTGYSLTENDPRLIEVKVQSGGKLIDKFKLVNFNEKKDNEHSFVPAGRTFLENIARKGRGGFVASDMDGLKNSLGELNFKDPVLVSDKKLAPVTIYRHKGIIVVFLFLGILSFYIKSRFYE